MRRAGFLASLGVAALLAAGSAWAGPQSFAVKTDAKTYQPGGMIDVSFTFHFEPATSIQTYNDGELGCQYFVTLEDRNGNLIASAGSEACDFVLDCEERTGPIRRSAAIPIPADVDCGVYLVRVSTGYSYIAPNNPTGIGGGPETILPVIICDEAGC